MIKRMRLAFLALISTLILGTSGLMLTEHLNFEQAFYLTVQTITTVGYGDIEIRTVVGRMYVVLLMMVGTAVMLYFAGLMMAFLVEGQLAGVYGGRKMERKIRQLNGHAIVCGAGRVGRHVIDRLRKEGAEFVVIEQQKELVNQLIEEGFLVINGDATLDDTLKKAGIGKAKGLVSALPEDSLNVFVTLTAKGLNPNIHVVARMDTLESEKKFLRAGCDKVISPAVLGGLRMAMSILKPISVDFLDTLIHNHNIEIEMEELKVEDGSCLVGKNLSTSGIKQQTGAMVLAILHNSQVISNPSAEEMICSGDILIVIGIREQLNLLEVLLRT